MGIDKYYNVVLKLAEEAGEVVKAKIWDLKTDVQLKDNPTDLVTETDKYIEEFLIGQLKQQFPDHKFIGEESTAAGIKNTLTDDPTWIIDPVDGTLNFVHGYPNVCISIGFTINKELVIGIINIPVPGMMFTAIKGRGAHLNGKQIHVSSVTTLSNALLTYECSGTSVYPEHLDSIIEYARIFLSKVQGYRAAGSAAYNMSMVALGGCDAYFEIGIHAWDYAAGALIVQEAGGVVMDTSGGPLDLMSRRMLCAATQSLADEIIPNIQQRYPPRDDQ